ncbi:MAG: GFA family protein [Thermodesulfobacteriota bacterium]
MSEKPKKKMIARCLCGSVELEVLGAPILSTACYCDDCQEAARQIEALPNAPSVLDPDGGTALLLYRKGRMKFSKGSEHLRDYKIRNESPTRRVVASCCNSAMLLDFQKGHWFSAYRKRFEGDVPPLQMRIQTKFKPENSNIPNDVPSYQTYPFKFIAKLMIARVAMLIHS